MNVSQKFQAYAEEKFEKVHLPDKSVMLRLNKILFALAAAADNYR